MSVLIKGMKKPTSCGQCILCLDDSRITNGYCMIFHCKVNMMELKKGCPLIEIPPHGDLIDINALKQKVLSYHYDDNASADLIKVFRAINLAPTIIPAEPPKEK